MNRIPETCGDDPRDQVVARARAGDRAALNFLISMVPDPLPARERQRFRDWQIRAADAWIQNCLPGAAPYFRSRMIAQAGIDVTARGRISNREMFAELNDDERDQLAEIIAPALAASRWPRWRRILEIII